MEKIVDYLKQLELSEIEAKLYITLLQMGPLTVRDLAINIGVKRTTAYLYIDQLVDKGLVMKLVKGSKKLVAAEEPVNLEQLVKEKVAHAKDVQEQFPHILKTITQTVPPGGDLNEAEIKYYKGKTGVMKIYEDALKAKELRSYVNFEILRKALPENEFLFPDGLNRNKDLKIFEILEDSPTSRHLLEEFKSTNSNNDRFSYKFLPHGVKLSSVDILIYEGKVAIIHVQKQLTGVVLQNTDYYENSKELFDLMWKIFQ